MDCSTGRPREAFDGFLKRARGGKSSVLVVCGEPGIGKTALLDYATNSALGFRVLRVAGVESEIELGSRRFNRCARHWSIGSSGYQVLSATRSGSRSG